MVEIKLCRKCRIEKPINYFHKTVRNKDGYKNICIECRKPEYLKPKEHVENFLQKRKQRFSLLGKSRKGVPLSSDAKKKLSESLKRTYARKFDPNETQLKRVFSRYRAYGLNWNINDFKKFTSLNCYYCGCSPGRIQRAKNRPGLFIYNGIDRVDNSIGYEIENCVPCCLMCNQAKLNHSQKDFIDWIKRVYENLSKSIN